LPCLARVSNVPGLPSLIRDRRTPAARRRGTHQVFRRDRFFRGWTPQNQQLAYVLHRHRAELGADLSQHRVALATNVAERAPLDELVRAQVDIDLAQDGGRQTVLADGNDGAQV